MRIEFHRTGAERKTLVTAIGEILEVKPKYKGMPSAAYEIGGFTVTKDGILEFDDSADSEEIEGLLERLADRGIAATPAEMAQAWLEARAAEQEGQEAATAPSAESTANDTAEAATAPQGGNVGCGCPVDTSCEARSTDRADRRDLTVAMPRETFTDAALENLQRLVEAKTALIKKALAVESLPIEVTEERVSFPWFAEVEGDSAQAYSHFITALCDMARNQKRVTAKEKDADNEKYAFRCFLLRLGFIGEEYKADRKILLKNLTGSSAFKNGIAKADEEVAS